MTQKLLQQGAEAKIILSDDFIIKDRIKKSYRIPELDDKIRKSRTRSEIKLLNKSSQLISVPLPLTTSKKSEQGDERTTSRVASKNSEVASRVIIKMPFIDGKKLSEHLSKFAMTKQKQICEQIGESVAKLHDANIIHGDLTTSNMILVENLPTHPDSQTNEISVSKKQGEIKTTYQKHSSLTNYELISERSERKEGGGRGRGGVSSKPIIFFIDFGLGFISRKIEDKAVDLHLLKQALEAKHFQNWETFFKETIRGYSKSKESKKVLEQLKKVEKRGRYKH